MQKIGEIEKRVLEYATEILDAESLAAVLVGLDQLSGEYGHLYHFVAERYALAEER